ncbi:hypothetical protein PHYSODRAFT_523025 [Phytophthora sojae]|uniref:Ubiquitin-like protease family profile domain-containing protein n=1 Tax=Phytophthora sojae (strain P6497) TaxID=1094619 RepID=G5A433_PHYSP|nr:hypothetical protein PHYSODRAFT_523025 [Phytophthora sojae]EGZ10292.1 hypothetical protein PHYSODRAFT_523025 [Phytophthora sojae]|eukprot:XP_009535153.1 hypothetical protein PHYSODRAFT_523025 [Phytophthora sojae]
MKLRALLRDKDVTEVAATLELIKPGVRELSSFLTSHETKKKGDGKSIQWMSDTEYICEVVRFRLPESVVEDALAKLRGGLAKGEEIELDSDGGVTRETEGYVAAIEKVGRFTRVQLEAMQSLWNWQATCRNAVLCCTWLSQDVKGICWPYTPLHGFGFDLTYADLFCFRDSAWLNDNALRAFTVFLSTYKNNVTVMVPPLKKGKMGKHILAPTSLDEVASGIEAHAFVFMPVNFGGVHWGCIVVDREARLVKTYDSMGGKRNKKRLKKMASELLAGPLEDEAYSDIEVTEPKQTDSDSCGVFADVSPSGVTKLRWAMLHKITTMKRS